MEKLKITKVQKMEMGIEIVKASDSPNKEIVLECLEHEIELLKRKSSKGGATKEMQEINEQLKQIVYNELVRVGEPITATDLLNGCQELQDFTYVEKGEEKIVTNQKISSLLKKLIDEDKTVTKETIKKKTYFSIVEN